MRIANQTLERQGKPPAFKLRFIGPQQAGMSPLHFVRGIRVELAEKALQAGKSVAQAVEISGFNSDLQLRRAWVAQGKLGLPSQAKVA